MNQELYVDNLLKEIENDLDVPEKELTSPVTRSDNKAPGVLTESIVEDLKQLSEYLDDEEKNEINSLIKRDAKCGIRVTNDKMSAILSYTPPLYGGKKMIVERIEKTLKKMGIVDYSLTKIEEILSGSEPVETVIAAGTSPESGADAKIDFYFKNDSNGPCITSDDRIDFKEFKSIQSIDADTLLLEIIPEQQGTEGKNVFGEVLPASPGNPVNINAGDNVRRDGNKFYSEKSGLPVLNGNRLIVKEFCVIPENVDFSTGNVEFSGDLYIKGDISEGFKVKTKNDLVVAGHIEAAVVRAGGSITVAGGIIGKDKGSVTAKDDIRSRFIENGIVYTRKNIIVSKAILHSNLSTLGGVYLLSNKGTIIGGRIITLKDVIARNIGSEWGARTDIIVGVNYRIDKLIKKIDTVMKKLQEDIVKVQHTLTRVEQDKDKSFKLNLSRKHLTDKLKKLARQKMDVLTGIDMNPRAELHCIENIYPGVRITIGVGAHVEIHQALSCVTFSLNRDKNKIVMRPFNFSYLKELRNKLKSEKKRSENNEENTDN